MPAAAGGFAACARIGVTTAAPEALLEFAHTLAAVEVTAWLVDREQTELATLATVCSRNQPPLVTASATQTVTASMAMTYSHSEHTLAVTCLQLAVTWRQLGIAKSHLVTCLQLEVTWLQLGIAESHLMTVAAASYKMAPCGRQHHSPGRNRKTPPLWNVAFSFHRCTASASPDDVCCWMKVLGSQGARGWPAWKRVRAEVGLNRTWEQEVLHHLVRRAYVDLVLRSCRPCRRATKGGFVALRFDSPRGASNWVCLWSPCDHPVEVCTPSSQLSQDMERLPLYSLGGDPVEAG